MRFWVWFGTEYLTEFMRIVLFWSFDCVIVQVAMLPSADPGQLTRVVSVFDPFLGIGLAAIIGLLSAVLDYKEVPVPIKL